MSFSTERKKGLLVFYVSYIKTPENPHGGVGFTSVFQKLELLLGDTSGHGWQRQCLRDTTCLAHDYDLHRDLSDFSPWVRHPLLSLTQTKLIIHSFCQTRSSIWFWINSCPSLLKNTNQSPQHLTCTVTSGPVGSSVPTGSKCNPHRFLQVPATSAFLMHPPHGCQIPLFKGQILFFVSEKSLFHWESLTD